MQLSVTQDSLYRLECLPDLRPGEIQKNSFGFLYDNLSEYVKDISRFSECEMSEEFSKLEHELMKASLDQIGYSDYIAIQYLKLATISFFQNNYEDGSKILDQLLQKFSNSDYVSAIFVNAIANLTEDLFRYQVSRFESDSTEIYDQEDVYHSLSHLTAYQLKLDVDKIASKLFYLVDLACSLGLFSEAEDLLCLNVSLFLESGDETISKRLSIKNNKIRIGKKLTEGECPQDEIPDFLRELRDLEIGSDSQVIKEIVEASHFFLDKLSELADTEVEMEDSPVYLAIIIDSLGKVDPASTSSFYLRLADIYDYDCDRINDVVFCLEKSVQNYDLNNFDSLAISQFRFDLYKYSDIAESLFFSLIASSSPELAKKISEIASKLGEMAEYLDDISDDQSFTAQTSLFYSLALLANTHINYMWIEDSPRDQVLACLMTGSEPEESYFAGYALGDFSIQSIKNLEWAHKQLGMKESYSRKDVAEIIQKHQLDFWLSVDEVFIFNLDSVDQNDLSLLFLEQINSIAESSCKIMNAISSKLCMTLDDSEDKFDQGRIASKIYQLQSLALTFAETLGDQSKIDEHKEQIHRFGELSDIGDDDDEF